MFTLTLCPPQSAKPQYSCRGSTTPNRAIFESLEVRRLFSATLKTLSVLGPDQGSNPRELISDNAGNLYGIASFADGSEGSTIFEIPTGTTDYHPDVIWSSLISTLPTKQTTPSGLAVDSSGNLYGHLNDGTPSPFEIAAGTNTMEPIAAIPTDALHTSIPDQVTDAAGNVYGTSIYGGNLSLNGGKGDGTVYKIPAGSHTKQTLVAFDGENGANPNVGLALDAAGNLYGTTQSAASNSNTDRTLQSTVFEISARTHKLTTLETFASDIAITSSLFVTSSGSIDGWTSAGQFGSVFEVVLDPNDGPSAVAPQTITLATRARASHAVVTGTSVQLSALGTSSNGASGLTCTWSVSRNASGAQAPTFSVNGKNTAQNSVATFHRDGTYRFRCTITDGNGQTIATDVSVVLRQKATRLKLTPQMKTVRGKGTTRISAVVIDQFGRPLRTQPGIQYLLVRGGGRINRSSGQFIAGVHSGLSRVMAVVGSLRDSLVLKVI